MCACTRRPPLTGLVRRTAKEARSTGRHHACLGPPSSPDLSLASYSQKRRTYGTAACKIGRAPLISIFHGDRRPGVSSDEATPVDMIAWFPRHDKCVLLPAIHNHPSTGCAAAAFYFNRVVIKNFARCGSRLHRISRLGYAVCFSFLLIEEV